MDLPVWALGLVLAALVAPALLGCAWWFERRGWVRAGLGSILTALSVLVAGWGLVLWSAAAGLGFLL